MDKTSSQLDAEVVASVPEMLEAQSIIVATFPLRPMPPDTPFVIVFPDGWQEVRN